jgi:predicted acyl esterase
LVPAPDDVALATDIYHPAGGRRFWCFSIRGTRIILRVCDELDRGDLARPLSRQLGRALTDGAGSDHTLTIELSPTHNLYTRGHRLRLDIASSNFPHFDINPNSGEPEGAMQHPRVAYNQIFVDAARPSHVLLPVLPSDA